MEHAAVLVLLLCVSCIIALETPPSLTKIAHREYGRVKEWNIVAEPHPLQQLDFKVLLKQRNLDVLEKTFWEVSDPKHANYGKHLSKKEVDAMIAPLPESKSRVLEWLEASGVPKTSMVVHNDYITITHPVHGVSKLFSTSFSVFKSGLTGKSRVRASAPVHIPTHLATDIDFVVGLSEFFEDKARAHSRLKAERRPVNSTLSSRKRSANVADVAVTPSVLQKYYGISTTPASNKASTIGIAGFGDYFSTGALAYFQTALGLPKTTVALNGSPCTSTAVNSCQQTESDLDVQYSSSLGNGVPTTFYSHDGSQWVMDWAQQLTAMSTPPLINSASYGWSEKEQCEVAQSECNSLGYTAQQYVSRTDTEFQQLGTRGVTILVSSGDDGAPSFFNGQGACPMDPTQFCPAGCPGTTMAATSCPEVVMTSGTSKCYYPMGGSSDSGGCPTVLANTNLNAAFSAFVSGNPTCGIKIINDIQGNSQFVTTCTCAALKTVTTDAITIGPYTYALNPATFESMYPAASAYVTSVGATQFKPVPTAASAPTGESVATPALGALISSGGGFSAFTPMPSYQSTHVATYLSSGTNVPLSGSFPSTNRAYPDIAFNGHNYQVAVSSGTTASTYSLCSGGATCEVTSVDGTSCSSPGLAGMLSKINDDLLNAGKSPMGFINPVLYQMHSDNPAAFNDINTGSNQCNRAYCCKLGYSAGAGYDPVSGLGTPVFSQMQSYFLSGAGASAGGDGASSASSVAVFLPLLLLCLFLSF